MTKKQFAKSMLVWLGIIPLAFFNSGLREILLIPLIGQVALPLSGIMLCVMVFLQSYLFIPRLGTGTQETYIKIGLLWIILTISFEFLLGFLTGERVSDMLNAYNPSKGNLWLFVVLFIGFTPWLVAKLKKMI